MDADAAGRLHQEIKKDPRLMDVCERWLKSNGSPCLTARQCEEAMSAAKKIETWRLVLERAEACTVLADKSLGMLERFKTQARAAELSDRLPPANAHSRRARM